MGRASCPGCRALRRRVAELEAIVRDLLAQLGRNAAKSSLPPSANPPAAAKPVVKEPTGRAAGGQPGHAPYQRVRLPAERVGQVIHHRPTHCRRCQHVLPAEPGRYDPPPTWHQVAELPEVAAVVTEHQGHTRTCPQCGTRTHAAIPADVRAHVVGPRLSATIAYLSGGRHDSKRGGPARPIGEELLCFVEDLFGCWYRVRDGTLSRASLGREIEQLRPAFGEVLGRGAGCGCAKTEAVCQNLLDWEPALWTFAHVE